jgi:hypothetical protein
MTNGPVTDKDLLARLKAAARREMTAEEIRSQRVSFVYGNLPKGNPMTKDQVAVVLARLEGD